MYIHAFVCFFVFATDRLQDNIFDHYNSFHLLYSDNRVILIVSPTQPAVSFETTVQKTYNKETRQSSSVNDTSATLAANNKNSWGSTNFCTYYKKSCYTEDKY
jgi:hypothetical protein